jgi:hypothetical protein
MEDGEEVEFGWDAEETPETPDIVLSIIIYHNKPYKSLKQIIKDIDIIILSKLRKKFEILVRIEEDEKEESLVKTLYKGYEHMSLYSGPLCESPSVNMEENCKGKPIHVFNGDLTEVKDWVVNNG